MSTIAVKELLDGTFEFVFFELKLFASQLKKLLTRDVLSFHFGKKIGHLFFIFFHPDY